MSKQQEDELFEICWNWIKVQNDESILHHLGGPALDLINQIMIDRCPPAKRTEFEEAQLALETASSA